VNDIIRPNIVHNVANEGLVLDLIHKDPELGVGRIASRFFYQ